MSKSPVTLPESHLTRWNDSDFYGISLLLPALQERDMPAPRIPMRTISEVLRLKYDAGLSHEKIARACGLSKGVVSKYVSLAQVAGISWPLPDGTDEAALEARLFPAKSDRKSVV